jgi:PAS domain S-box-containing protein
MANDGALSDRLQLTLAKTTAAAFAVSSAEGPQLFGELALRLAEILGVDAVIIGEFVESAQGRIRTLAACLDGRLLRQFEYDLEGTPCRGVVNRESRFATGIRDEFKPGTLFHAQGFDSYAARSMVDGTGRQIGLIAAMHRAPISDRELTEALLQIFAVRTTAELDRRRAEAAMRASEQSYRAIFDAAEDAIFVHDFATGAFVDVNSKACEAYGYPREQLMKKRVADLSSNVPPYTEKEAIKRLEAARRGEPQRFDWHRRNRDGSLHWDEVVLKCAKIGGAERIVAFTREITERRNAEEALRLREEQYRAIFEGSSDALVLWSADIRIVDVNSAFTRMYGFTRDEIIGTTFGDRLPMDDIDRRIEMIRAALAGRTGQLETVTRRKDGELFDVEVRYVPITHRGEPHVLAVARDITERRRSEERLRASEARYKLLFEMESDAIVLVDAATLRIVDANRAAVELYGYSREELLSMSAQNLSDEPILTARSINESQGFLTIPLRRHRRKNGEIFTVEITANRLELGGRRIVLAAIRDISERRVREEALKRSEERLRATVEAAFDCVVAMDAQGRILDFNAAAERCFGYPRNTVVGKPLGDTLIPERHRAAHEAGLKRYLAGGPGAYIGRRVETTALRADGSEFPIELTISAVPSAEGSIFIGFLRDLTDIRRAESQRNELEAQLRQAQKMDAIGHLTGGIAHDFNNILTSVMGYVVLASERPAAESDAKLQEHLEHAQQACRRARDLIQQMLMFSRGKRGDARAVGLVTLVDESVRMLRATLPTTLELIAAHDDPETTVWVDPVQLQQVVLNLAINARDAIDGPGRVAIETTAAKPAQGTCASCRRKVDGRFVELTVSDSGAGIGAGTLERMFEPFFTTKPVGRGSGMGLAIVHGIVHEYGGHLLVDSAPGRGTAFRVLLPAAPEARSPPRRTSTTGGRARRALSGNVLLVDDETSVLDFMRQLLEGWGLQVTALADPGEALRTFEADLQAFDLLLTDQTMPGTTGLELARRVAALRPGIPVLLYSGHGEMMLDAPIDRAGVTRLLPKPVEPAALHNTLEELLRPAGVES